MTYIDDHLAQQTPQAKAAQKLLADAKAAAGRAPSPQAAEAAEMGRAKKLLDAGHTLDEVAREHELQVPTLQNLLRQYGHL